MKKKRTVSKRLRRAARRVSSQALSLKRKSLKLLLWIGALLVSVVNAVTIKKALKYLRKKGFKPNVS